MEVMPKARNFARVPRPKLQPRPSVHRTRQNNTFASSAQVHSVDCARDGKGSNSNGSHQAKHDGEYWHRQDFGTARSPASNASKAKKRGKILKPVLRGLIALFACLAFFCSVLSEKRENNSHGVTEAEWENAFQRHDGSSSNHDIIPNHDNYGRLKHSSADGSTRDDAVATETQSKGKLRVNVGGGDRWRGMPVEDDKENAWNVGTHSDDQLDQQARNAEGLMPIDEDAMNIQRSSELIRRQGTSEENSHFAEQVGGSQHRFIQKRESSRLRYSPGVPLPNQHVQEKIDFLSKDLKKKKFKPTKQLLNQVKTSPHTISGLDCILYGGPPAMPCQDLIYWKDIPSDSEYTSPFYYSKEQHQERNIMDDDITANIRSHQRGNEIRRDTTNKYITFEPDNTGGWNYQRMAFETILTLSAAMGRTLVLPPRQGLSLLSQGSQSDRMVSYDDFYHLDSLNDEYKGINIITTEEFLLREGLTGNLFRYGTSDSVYVPDNRTSWDDITIDGVLGPTPLASLWQFFQTVSYVADSWDPTECIAAFPATAGPEGNVGLSDLMQDILLSRDRRPKPQHLDFQGRPIPTDAAPIERMREMMAGRSRLCLYDDEMQSAAVVHFPYFGPNSKPRLLTHFYSFVFFEQWRQAMWANRLIRDHVRYRDEIMCAAGRVVEAIQKDSMQQGNDGMYNSMHVHRQNFQQSDLSNISEEEIFDSLSEVEMGSTIFVTTDENSELFFTRLRERYNLVFLKDYGDLLGGINVNYYSMVEQIVAARGYQFYGTFSSAFSAHISRLRGYYSERDKILGHSEGKLTNTFFMPRIYRNELRVYQAVQQPFYAREFPIAWKDADNGVGEMIWKGL